VFRDFLDPGVCTSSVARISTLRANWLTIHGPSSDGAFDRITALAAGLLDVRSPL
jgi:hypothetical protein